MQAESYDYSPLFSSQLEETHLLNLEATGEVPRWLSGNFISTGPAQFECGSTQLKHWFDGLAMLKKFEFKSGRVTFQSQYLRSKQYLKSLDANELYYNEFATRSGLLKPFLRENYYDNCNVNTAKINNEYIAMTESPNFIKFNINNLSTEGAFKWEDNLKAHIALAHPHFDAEKQEIINVNIEIGPKNKYHIYKLSTNTKKRELIKTYISQEFFYMHSFSITPRYVILFKTPLVLSKFKLIARYPFMDTFSYDQKSKCAFVILDRNSKEILEIEADPFVCLHGANAYEQGPELVLDLICYGRGNPYDHFYLNPQPKIPNPYLKRYFINLNTKNYRAETITTNAVEFPRLNYSKCNGQPYSYLYTVAKTNPIIFDIDAIQKTNVETGKIWQWSKSGYYPGEPVFVPNPVAKTEDEGAVLVIAYNAHTQKTNLVILNAEDLQQMAELPLPTHLPLGLHGNFYKA